jgi:hypothetical protein
LSRYRLGLKQAPSPRLRGAESNEQRSLLDEDPARAVVL